MATVGRPAWPYAAAEAEALPRAERLLLDLARLQAEAARGGRPALPALSLPCIAEGAAGVARPAERLLRGLDLPVAGPHAPGVTPAEGRLLFAVALAQHGMPLVGAALIAAAPTDLTALARALGCAGLHLAAPAWPRRRRSA